MNQRPHTSTRFPYTTLFRSDLHGAGDDHDSADGNGEGDECGGYDAVGIGHGDPGTSVYGNTSERGRDRKSTRLNSSHASISYAVFWLEIIDKECDQQHQRSD